jgi:nitric oxide reductase NorD protein
VAEPEELILEGAHFATRVVRDAWRRYGARTSNSSVPLGDLRVRLEVFLTALLRHAVDVAAMEPPAATSWLARLARGPSPRRRHVPLASATDGRRVFLPPSLPREAAGLDPLALYHLLGVQQAARLVRRTPQAFAAVANAGLREWFLVAEAATIDRWIAREAPGLVPGLVTVRREILAAGDGTRMADSPLGDRIRALLASEPSTPPFDAGGDGSPAASLEWARAQVDDRRPRRPVGDVLPWYWGRILPAPPLLGVSRVSATAEPGAAASRSRVAEMRRRPRIREAGEDEDDAAAGTWVIRADEPQESVEDALGLQRPADRDDHADPEGLGDSLSELPEARMVATPAPAREVLRSGDPFERRPGPSPPAPPVPHGFVYPEWDHRLGAYRARGAVVRDSPAPLGDGAWVDAALTRHATLVTRVRATFERLRPRYVRLDRQADGPELDVAACVAARADLRAGVPVDGRVYVDQRPARRELAVALLVDVSASTDSWVADARRIVDVEKDALLVVCEALDALGDRYGVFAFSGEGAERVTVRALKSFDGPRSRAVDRRIAALDAEHYTRVGAAVRHVTAALGRERATRRLLLMLSDGKPNDVDVYEGPYGIEDTRQAVAEARRQGVKVFCLTVDREAPRYAGRIFGRDGYTVLRRAEELPVVLTEVLRSLVKR